MEFVRMSTAKDLSSWGEVVRFLFRNGSNQGAMIGTLMVVEGMSGEQFVRELRRLADSVEEFESVDRPGFLESESAQAASQLGGRDR